MRGMARLKSRPVGNSHPPIGEEIQRLNEMLGTRMFDGFPVAEEDVPALLKRLAVLDGCLERGMDPRKPWDEQVPQEEAQETWRTLNGVTIRIEDMSDKHLKNVIAWVGRSIEKADTGMMVPTRIAEEVRKRGFPEYAKIQEWHAKAAKFWKQMFDDAEHWFNEGDN